MASELIDFKKELHQDIALDAAIAELYPDESFFDLVSSILGDAGIVDGMEYAPYRDSTRKIKIDGFSWNELEKVFSGVIIHLGDEPLNVETISRKEIEGFGKRVFKYLSEATSRQFRDSLDVSSVGKNTADFLSSIQSEVLKYRVILITDSVVSDRVKNIQIEAVNEMPTSIEVWDLERLMKLVQSAHETEEFTVDFSTSAQNVQVIEASRLPNGSVTYMGIMPATVLAKIYGDYGQRLLESNVRTFLDFRAGPNKAMKQGLVLEPEKFFSYNNGLTITASSASIENINGVSVIRDLDNMQIVNGGQTTATIYFTPNELGGLDTEQGKLLYRDVDLSKVSVQMKLTVMNVDDFEFANNYKADISRFANFQTAVNAGDLSSNSPFHKDIERLSRRTSMPIGELGFPTKWFYERARGQYSTKKRGLSAVGLKKFTQEFPKAQVFTKDMLNKYEVTWQMQPHIVKKGTTPARNFLMSQVKASYSKDPSYRVETDYFQDLISKMILFKEVDKAVLKSDWYKAESGLKAEAVTYSIALVRKTLIAKGLDINLAYIYQNQTTSDQLKNTIVEVAGVIRRNIMNSQFRAGSGNVSEFCRNENGWKRIQMIDIDIDSLMYPDVVNSDEQKEIEAEMEQVGEASAHMSDYEKVMAVPADEWQKLASHNLRSYRLESPQVNLPSKCAQMHRGGRALTEKQLGFVLKIYDEAKSAGFEYGRT
jgi:hypothetical protein